jgi:aryl-alcohol dehydrogenase-like predicted oxidoreductase
MADTKQNLSKLPQRELGQGLKVSALGLGCMGMTYAYGKADEAESLKTLRAAFDLGINFLDTAEVYGPFTNEKLVGKAIKEVPRESVIVATKFGFKFGEGKIIGTDSRPEHVREVCEASLQRLGVEYIDLFYQHRVDQDVPIEETIGALAQLVKEGKIRHLGMSEASAATIRRAHKVHPITALQSEYSLWERNVEKEILPTLKELGIGFVPYSPLGRGFLTGKIKEFDALSADDFRRQLPRFTEENIRQNQEIVAKVEALAKARGATSGQIALAWVLGKGEHFVPIPGTTREKHLKENAASAFIELTADEVAALDQLSSIVAGARYNDLMMSLVNK